MANAMWRFKTVAVGDKMILDSNVIADPYKIQVGVVTRVTATLFDVAYGDPEQTSRFRRDFGGQYGKKGKRSSISVDAFSEELLTQEREWAAQSVARRNDYKAALVVDDEVSVLIRNLRNDAGTLAKKIALRDALIDLVQ